MQYDFKNKSYSLSLRDYLIGDLLEIKNFSESKYLINPVSNAQSFYSQKISTLLQSHNKNSELNSKLHKACSYLDNNSYWNNRLEQAKKLMPVSMIGSFYVLAVCNFDQKTLMDISDIQILYLGKKTIFK